MYNVENQNQLNIDRSNRLQNVAVRVTKNSPLEKEKNIIRNIILIMITKFGWIGCDRIL